MLLLLLTLMDCHIDIHIVYQYLKTLHILNFLNSKMESSDCNSAYDLITLEEWSETPPNVKIRFYSENGKTTLINCYQAETLKEWLKNPENKFALWVEKPEEIMDLMGYGGQPDLNRLVVKLYTGEFIIYDEIVKVIMAGIRDFILDAYPIGIKRIGNIKGEFGISMLHGQFPGYRVYKLALPGVITENLIQYLSNDLLYQILKQLPLKDVYNFVNSSKSMRTRLMPIYIKLRNEKQKEKDITDLIRNYNFSDPEKDNVYNEIVRRAKLNNEVYKLIGSIQEEEDITQHLPEEHFQGNIYRAILELQNYLYDNFNYNLLEIRLEYVLERVFVSYFEVSNFENIQKDPKLYKKYIDLSIKELINYLTEFDPEEPHLIKIP